MIEYIIFFSLLIIITFIFIINREGLFLIVLSNVIIFSIELIYPQSIYLLAYNTSNPLSINLLTGIFAHYNYMHILFNMVVLLFIGFPLEVRIGTRRFLIIYLFTGILSEIIFSLIYIGSETFLFGASGAIFGVMGALLRLYPDDEIPMFLGFILLPRLKVKYAVLFAAITEFLAIFLSYENDIAHIVHVSSLVIGILIAPFISGMHGLSSLQAIASDEESRKLLREIMKERIPEMKKILLEEFLKKKCKKYEINKNYVLCDGKKYRL
jgi:membrane associated rhomboid family serine protease